MRVTITGRHYTVTDTMRRYVERKAPRLLKYFPQLLDLHVTLSLEKFRANAELVAVGSHLKVSAKSEGHQMQEAFDETYAKLAEHLRRAHDKRRAASHRRETVATAPRQETQETVE